MALLRDFVKIYKKATRVFWIGLCVLLFPLIGSVLAVVYLSEIESYLKSGGFVGVAVFLILSMILMGVSLLPSYFIAIISGWLFGLVNGSIISITSIVLASLFGYWLSKVIISDTFKEALNQFEKFKSLDEYLRSRPKISISLIFLMRLSPVFPFAFTNVLLASLQVKIKEFTAGTFAGMLPRSVLAVFIGSQLVNLNFDRPFESSTVIIGIIATIFLLFFISRLADRSLKA